MPHAGSGFRGHSFVTYKCGKWVVEMVVFVYGYMKWCMCLCHVCMRLYTSVKAGFDLNSVLCPAK